MQSIIINRKYLFNCKSHDVKTYISACHGYGVLAAILQRSYQNVKLLLLHNHILKYKLFSHPEMLAY